MYSKGVLDKLRLIQEGNIEEIETDPEELLNDEDKNLEDDNVMNSDDFAMNDEFLSEVNLAILRHELNISTDDTMRKFLTENHDMLIRDKILTENALNQSFISLSPMARRAKAVNLLKLKMAKQAGDPRYRKAVRLRALWKRLLDQIRNDSRYKKAETIISRQQFRIVRNPEAIAAVQKFKSVKLK